MTSSKQLPVALLTHVNGVTRYGGCGADRYLGYLKAQKAAMTGQPGAHTNRPELVAVHGYDTKYATHAL